MKKILLIICALFSLLSFGQSPQGGQRICGNQYSAYGLTGITLSAALDIAGQIHNEYQEYSLQKLSKLDIDFTDTVNLKRIISESSTPFFEPKGLIYDKNSHSLNLATYAPTVLSFSQNNYSTKGYDIMNQLQNKLNLYQANNDVYELLSELMVLKDSALLLNDESEVFSVGIPISIAISSFTYWQSNGQRWMDLFAKDDGLGVDGSHGPSALNFKQPRVNLAHLGGADLSGAIGGAMAGGFAGAVLVSATSSLGNLANQVIGSYVSWWPW